MQEVLILQRATLIHAIIRNKHEKEISEKEVPSDFKHLRIFARKKEDQSGEDSDLTQHIETEIADNFMWNFVDESTEIMDSDICFDIYTNCFVQLSGNEINDIMFGEDLKSDNPFSEFRISGYTVSDVPDMYHLIPNNESMLEDIYTVSMDFADLEPQAEISPHNLRISFGLDGAELYSKVVAITTDFDDVPRRVLFSLIKAYTFMRELFNRIKSGEVGLKVKIPTSIDVWKTTNGNYDDSQKLFYISLSIERLSCPIEEIRACAYQCIDNADVSAMLITTLAVLSFLKLEKGNDIPRENNKRLGIPYLPKPNPIQEDLSGDHIDNEKIHKEAVARKLDGIMDKLDKEMEASVHPEEPTSQEITDSEVESIMAKFKNKKEGE